MCESDREKIKAVAGDREVVYFTGAITNIAGAVPLSALLQLTSGAITLAIKGEKARYEFGAASLEAVKERMNVEEIKGVIGVELQKSHVIDYGWIENYTATTGE